MSPLCASTTLFFLFIHTRLFLASKLLHMLFLLSRTLFLPLCYMQPFNLRCQLKYVFPREVSAYLNKNPIIQPVILCFFHHFFFFGVACEILDISSLIRDQTCVPCSRSTEF